MTDVKDRLSMFESQQTSSESAGKRRRPPPPPPKGRSLAVPSPTSSPTISNTSPGETGSEKIHKLNPALLKSLDKAPGRGGLSPAVTAKGGGTAAGKSKSLSPAFNKKSKSARKLPSRTQITANGNAEVSKVGVGLLASVTKDISVSTGNLNTHSPSTDPSSISSSSSFSTSKRRPSPSSVHIKATSASPPKLKSRKIVALSMDISRVNAVPSHQRKPPRPVSTGSAHRINPTTGKKTDISPSLLNTTTTSPLTGSPSGSPSLSRGRNDSFDSFEDSYSPPPSSSLSSSSATRPVSSTSSHNSLAVHQPVKAVSRSTDNLLESPIPIISKPRSNSEDPSPKLLPPPRERKPKPPPPPKKPGLMAAASKPHPPPKPHIGQLKKSPQFNRRVNSPEARHATSSFTNAQNRFRSTSTNSEPMSPSQPDIPRESPIPSPMMSSPNSSAPLRQRRGEFSGVSSPLPPSTPSPRTSQLEAIQRNADSGFASETAEELYSPVERGTNTSSIDQQVEREEEAGVKMRETEEPTPAVVPEVWDEARVEKARNKRLHIAEELLKTEATYVERLHVIAVKFHGAVTEFNTKHVIPDADINRIFLNISQIHNLNTNILEELQKRMDTWNTREGLGDVIERLAPFLKLYAHYTAGFEDAMKILTSWTKREKKFDILVREFERELSTGLGVAHYMLEPIQRIPRYKLLLTDYLKYTPPDSPDRQPTEKALGIISEAADHSNDRIKELENSNTILSIQRSLQDFEGTLLAPGRLYIRGGQLQKFSRKTTTPRMFFLFSDILLHTEPAGTDVYKFKNEMPIFMMKVEEPMVSLVPYSFNVESTTRSLILVASSEAEKNEWMMYLRRAINEERKKRSSLRREMTRVALGVLGAQAPIMVPDKSVTMCQTCSAVFTFTFRRHHCRGCGKVVCGGCSQWKAYLPYLKKIERVCERCNYSAKSESGDDVVPSPPSQTTKKEGILDLKGYEEDTIKGGYVLCQDGRKWNRLWYQLKQDFCLYKFRAHEDIKAMSSLPLPGYIVKSDLNTHTINLIHPSSKKELCDTFRLENPEDFDIWVLALESVVQLEMPSLPSESKMISPPPIPTDERTRSQSLRDVNAIADQDNDLLDNSI